MDPHEIRMQMGQTIIGHLEALDDETIALMEPACEAIGALTERLKAQGLPPAQVVQFAVGMIIGAAFHDQDWA